MPSAMPRRLPVPAPSARRRAVGLAAGAALAVAGCARRPVDTGATPVGPEPAAPAPSAPTRPAARPTTFAWAVGARRGVVETEVAVTRDGAPGERETVRTRAALAFTVGAAAPATGARPLVGTVDSLVVRAGARVRGDTSTAPGDGADVTTGVRFRGLLAARAVRLDPDSGVDARCATREGAAALAALAAARERFPRLAASLVAGARWRDTTVTATCAGPALVIVQTESRYEVAGVEGDGTVRVTRRSTSTLRGTGTAGVRPVQVTGTGSASWRYRVDPGAGDLVEGDGESRTALAVSVAGSATRFVQEARTRVR